MQLTLHKGTKGKTIHLFLTETGLADDIGGVQACFIGEGDAAPTPIALEPGAFREVDAAAMPGLFALNVPDEVLAVKGHTAVLMLRVPGAAPAVVHFDLVAYDPYDGERMGLACLSKDSRHACLEAAFRDVVPDIVSELQQE